MYRDPKINFWSRIILWGCLSLLISCTARKKENDPSRGQSDLSVRSSISYNMNPFAGVVHPPQVSEVLRNSWVHTIDADALWAMSQCNCAPNASTKYLQRLATTFGAVPQTLVPDVREKILNDPKLKTINDLPGGIGDIADLFVGLYVTDGKIAEQVRTGVDEMVQKSVPGSAVLSQGLNYRFDLFSNLNLPKEIKIPESPKAFSVGDQSIIWTEIFAQDQMWTGSKPLAFNDHGFQFFMTLKSLAEWKYILGLDASKLDGKIYGGLTFDAIAGVNRSPLAPYDPRKQPSPSPRFISGQYTVQYPNVKALDMALKVQETWQPGAAEASLTEQALLLNAAAKAFSRMRPRNQNASKSIYESNGGVLPNDAYQLPIAFLPGTAKALETFFINQKELQIYQIGDKPSDVGSDRLKADISSVSKLMSAMKLWVEETKNLDDMQSASAVRQQLVQGHETMLKLLRMTTQTMLGEFVREDNTNRSPFGIMLVKNSSTMEQPTLAESAEALAVLANVEQELLPSDLLRQRIHQLFHWFAGTYFPKLAQGSLPNLTLQDILWTRQALQRFAFYPDAIKTAWFNDAYKVITQQITSWDGRVP